MAVAVRRIPAALSWRMVRQASGRIQLGYRGSGHVQPDELLAEHFRRPHVGRRTIRRLQPGLCDLRAGNQRVTRPFHRASPDQVQRHDPADLAARHRALHGHRATRGPGHRHLRTCCRQAGRRHDRAGLSRPRPSAARTYAAGQLALRVFRGRDAVSMRSSTTRSGPWSCFPHWCSCGSPATPTCSGL